MAKPKLHDRLLEQQFWCWGHDVRHQPNLLAAYGFDRVPPPPTARERGAISRYELACGEFKVVIWGWGILYSRVDLGSVFISRQALVPIAPDSQALLAAWLPVKVAHTTMPANQISCALISEMVKWIADYEAWVCQGEGITYRRACLSGKGKRKLAVAPAEVPTEWINLGKHISPRGQTVG